MSDRNTRRAGINYAVGIVLALLSAAVMYAERIVLVRRMDIVYAGFNSLFENSFLILSAFDIGVTTYLMNYLLSAVKTADEIEICSSLRTVGRCCRIASLIILSLGLVTALFMPLLSGEKSWRVSILFVIYLLGQLGQYIFGHRVLLLSAMQRNWVVSVFVQTGRIAGELLALFIILRTQNYFLYITAISALTFLSYLLIYLRTGHDYPYLKVKGKERERGERIGRNALGMTFHRGSFVFYRSLEPVLVSVLFGSSVAGLYSNYLLVTSAFLTPFWIYQSTVTPTVTLKYLGGTKEENLALYRRSVYFNFILSLLAALLALVLYTPYITLSFGEDYLLGTSYDAIFSFLVFLSSFRTTAVVFRDAAGIYSRDWKKAVAEILTALVLSLILSRFMGLMGIPVAFTSSYILVVLWRENRTVLESALGEDRWDFCAEEAFLMALGLIVIVAVWYVTGGMSVICRVLSAISFWALTVALWLFLFPSSKKALFPGRKK